MSGTSDPSRDASLQPPEAIPVSRVDDAMDSQVSAPELAALSLALGLPVQQSLTEFTPDPAFLKSINISFARTHRLMGFDIDGITHVAICDQAGWKHLDTACRMIRRSAEPLLATEDAIVAAINTAYSDRGSQAQAVLESIDKNALVTQIQASGAGEDLLDTEGRAPIIRLVNQLLFDAVKAGASDVHVQPYEDRVIVRQRIDGVLFDSFEVPKAIQEEVLTRIKVLGQMNIAEKRLPQDGRATVQLGDRVVDLRIASLPTSHNERIVIRLLDKSARLYTLGELGMPTDSLAQFRQLIRYDHGLILVTGPTGSGKSTTLYGALQEINSTDLNVLTLEDPIEYQLDGISQTQINEKKGLTFASGLRSVLRQDPDIVMVGEIRDQETAQMAIQASLTGHLVFSTLHTNDAASAVTRLLDLGIEPYLVSSSLIGSLAQRLVRRLCDNCKTPIPPEVGKHGTFYGPEGCENCRQTGYRGRVGLYELLTLSDPIRELIQQRANAAEIRQAGLDTGLRLLSWDGIDKVQEGVTTKDEVLRVTSLPED